MVIISTSIRLCKIGVGIKGKSMTTVIFDTDIGADSDDAVAFAYICTQVKENKCKLPLVSLSTSRKGAVAFTRAVLHSYGLNSEICQMQKTLPCDTYDHYARKSIDKYGFADDAQDVLDSWEQVYTQSKESITLIVVGPQTNLAAFIQKNPPLFFEKTAGIYIMGGRFDKEVPEFNIENDISAAKYVCENSKDIPRYYLPFEEGFKLFTGKAFYKKWEHPIGFALKNMALACGIQKEEDFVRRSWDPLTCLAVFSPELFQMQAGEITIDDKGISTFKKDGNEKCFLLTMQDVRLCGEEIERNLLIENKESNV